MGPAVSTHRLEPAKGADLLSISARPRIGVVTGVRDAAFLAERFVPVDATRRDATGGMPTDGMVGQSLRLLLRG